MASRWHKVRSKMFKKEQQSKPNLPSSLKPQAPQVASNVAQQIQPKPVGVAFEVSFSGPLPAPVILKEYDTIVPGLASRIVEMAEKEQAHRHQYENQTIEIQKSGQSKGFYIAMAVIVGGIVLIWTGHSGYGFATILLTGAALIGAAIYGRMNVADKQLTNQLAELAKAQQQRPPPSQ